MNKDEKARLWSERIREFRSSGQTCRDWCTEHQIPVSTMTYWICKLKNEKNTLYPGRIYDKWCQTLRTQYEQN